MKTLPVSCLVALLLAVTASPVFADSAPTGKAVAVGSVEARAFPPVIHVGDEVRLVIQAHFPKGFSIEPISAKTAFAPFELRSIDKPLAIQKDGRVFQTVIIRLTIFEMGDFKIPSIPVAVWSITGRRAQARTRAIPVKVVSIGKTKDDKADIRPIKGPAVVSLRYLYDWLLAAAAFLLGMLWVFQISRRHRKKMENLEALLPPQERLARELGRLNENEWISSGKVKEHYSGLSDILRRYLERRYGFDVMEHTTAEIVVLLKQKNFQDGLVARVRDILEKTDLVKFARFTPERSLAAEMENKLLPFAEETKVSQP